MNIVVLMAGSSKLFISDGCLFPKMLLEVAGKTVVQRVIENINPLINNNENKVIFVIRSEDSSKYYLDSTLKLLCPNSKIVMIPEGVSGAAISALLVIEHINEDESLLIFNGDQIIDADLLEVVNNMEAYDGGVIVFESVHPRWSYVKLDKDNLVSEAREKKPISNSATAGFYFFKIARDFIESTKQSVLKGSDLDGKFYVCPIFNEMILDGKKITAININSSEYHSLMNPKMLDSYEDILIKNY